MRANRRRWRLVGTVSSNCNRTGRHLWRLHPIHITARIVDHRHGTHELPGKRRRWVGI